MTQPLPFATVPLFLRRRACGDLITCTSEQWQQPCKLSPSGTRSQGAWRSLAHTIGVEGGFIAQRSHAGQVLSSGGEEAALWPGLAASEEGTVGRRRAIGGKKPKGIGNRKCSREDERFQRQRLDELELQRPLLIGPCKGLTESLVLGIARRFGGAVRRAQVMRGGRSQSERCSLMLWLTRRASVSVADADAGDGGWLVTIDDPISGRTVVKDLKGVIPAGLEQVDKPAGVQQAERHFVPELDAIRLGGSHR